MCAKQIPGWRPAAEQMPGPPPPSLQQPQKVEPPMLHPPRLDTRPAPPRRPIPEVRGIGPPRGRSAPLNHRGQGRQSLASSRAAEGQGWHPRASTSLAGGQDWRPERTQPNMRAEHRGVDPLKRVGGTEDVESSKADPRRSPRRGSRGLMDVRHRGGRSRGPPVRGRGPAAPAAAGQPRRLSRREMCVAVSA